MNKYYYTYKITLLKGSKEGYYYFGKRQCNILPDNYAGSGKIVLDYYKKYGKIEGETYIKEIIAFYDSPEDLNKAEFELIGDKYTTDALCLNLKRGGEGGGGPQTDETRAKIKKNNSKYWLGKKRPSMNKGKEVSTEERNKISNTLHMYFEEHPEAREHLSIIHKCKTPWNKGMTKEQMKEYKNKVA